MEPHIWNPDTLPATCVECKIQHLCKDKVLCTQLHRSIALSQWFKKHGFPDSVTLILKKNHEYGMLLVVPSPDLKTRLKKLSQAPLFYLSKSACASDMEAMHRVFNLDLPTLVIYKNGVAITMPGLQAIWRSEIQSAIKKFDG